MYGSYFLSPHTLLVLCARARARVCVYVVSHYERTPNGTKDARCCCGLAQAAGGSAGKDGLSLSTSKMLLARLHNEHALRAERMKVRTLSSSPLRARSLLVTARNSRPAVPSLPQVKQREAEAKQKREDETACPGAPTINERSKKMVGERSLDQILAWLVLPTAPHVACPGYIVPWIACQGAASNAGVRAHS